jgi:hypothetical protein
LLFATSFLPSLAEKSENACTVELPRGVRSLIGFQNLRPLCFFPSEKKSSWAGFFAAEVKKPLVGTQSDICDERYQTELDIGTSDIKLKWVKSKIMQDIELNFSPIPDRISDVRS